MFYWIKKYLLIFFLIITITIILTNFITIIKTKDKILTIEEVSKLKNIDCILILGASTKGNNPSPMLEERLIKGITLYNNKISPKILVSGDHIKADYDEVNAMKDYLIGHQIPSQDVFMDHAGISTYDSIYRTKNIFKAQKIIIVTQKYHLYRALYIANQLNIDAFGIPSDQTTYKNQYKREIREYLARTKDFFKSILKPSSTYLGEELNIKGNGDLTNDFSS